jgi:hypothetical protein
MPHKSIIEGYIYYLFCSAFWDGALFSLFDKAVPHLPVILYDILIVGAGGMAISQYILYNYYNILKNYIPLLFILYLLTMMWFFYVSYKYNPDLSNIKGFVFW